MTKADILLAMAVELGINDYDGDGLATLPGNPATLQRLRAAFEAGRVTLYAEDPRFHFLRPSSQFTLDPTGAKCIDADPTRYAMPSGVIAPPTGAMTYSFPDGSDGQSATVEVTSWARVNRLRSTGATNTGRPQFVAFWPMTSASIDEGPRYEMRVWPPPDLAYILEAPFQLEAAPMADDNEVEPSGYPLAVKAYGIWEFQRANPVATGPTQEMALSNRNEWLGRIKINEASRQPRTLGKSAYARPRGARRFTGSDRDTEWIPIPVTLSDGSTLGG